MGGHLPRLSRGVGAGAAEEQSPGVPAVALASAERAAELLPCWVEAHFRCAQAHLLAGDPRGAEPCVRRGLGIDGGHAGARALLRALEAGKGVPEAAPGEAELVAWVAALEVSLAGKEAEVEQAAAELAAREARAERDRAAVAEAKDALAWFRMR